MKAIIELVANILNGNVTLKQKALSSLRKYKSQMRSLAAKKFSLKRKRVIIRKGGFLNILLSTLGPALLSALLSKI